MERELFKQKMAQMPPPTSKTTQVNKEDLKVDSWNLYFDSKLDVQLPNTRDTFRVYRAGDPSATAFVFLHGAGHSALSWALTAAAMKEAGSCQLLAYDCRAHGATQTEDEEDLSVERLTEDAIQLINEVFKSGSDAPTPPKIILVGHSMGGAIAARAAASNRIGSMVGVAVVDVVEGTAMAALSSMHSILAERPTSFPSLERAIEWSISSGNLKKIESARVSIPPQLKEAGDKYVWRTNLPNTESFWKGWFQGLSKTFLSVQGVKMLVLAGTDRLDKDLTIAQMQGKFQLVLLPACGHTIQEDDPKKMAQTLLQYQQRYKF